MSKKKASVSDDSSPAPPLIPSTRITLACLVFFAFVIQYSQRVNLPIGIVCMANRTKPIGQQALLNSTIQTDKAITSLSESTTTRVSSSVEVEKGGIFKEKQFLWTESQEQYLLGGYWAGYVFTQIPGGWLATTIGAKVVYATSLGTSSVATSGIVFMYLMSNTQFYYILILRFITGLAHGVLFPATVALWSLWAVPQERSTLASIGFGGTHLGTSATMLIGGVLCQNLNAGWMYLFSYTSALGFVWLILWLLLTSDSPNNHPRISDEEKNYICKYTGSSGAKRNMSFSSVPWKKIITSKPLNALVFTHMANLFGLFFFLTNLGKILNQLLLLSPQTTGYILAFGFFLTLLSSLSSGIITDYFVKSKVVTLTNARKISTGLTSFLPVLCMVSLYFCDASRRTQGIATVLLFLASSGLGYGSGYVVNFTDVAPAYSGIILGIANALASIAGLTGNVIAGIIIKQPTLQNWRKLYIIFGTVYFLAGVIYVLFGTAVTRKWAKLESASAKQIESKLDEEEAIPMTAQS